MGYNKKKEMVNDILNIVAWQEMRFNIFIFFVCWGPPDAPEGLPPNVDSIAMALLPVSHYYRQNEHHLHTILLSFEKNSDYISTL